MALPDLPAFTRLLGVNVLHRSPERTEAELPVREELCNRRGVLHGGAVMALGDMLGGMTARVSLPDGGRTATIESKTNFFAGVPRSMLERFSKVQNPKTFQSSSRLSTTLLSISRPPEP